MLLDIDGKKTTIAFMSGKTRSELARPGTSELTTSDAELLEDIRGYADKARAENTKTAYKSDLAHFREWCALKSERGVIQSSLPAEPVTVAGYISELANGKADGLGKRKTSTIRRRLASIAAAHGQAGLPDPTKDERVKQVWHGIRNTHGTRVNKKDALVREMARTAAEEEGEGSLVAMRNKTILLFAPESAMRQSELTTMLAEDVKFSKDGMIYTFSKATKGNQEGKLEQIGILRESDSASCPVAALEAWLKLTGITKGYIFPGRKPGDHLSGKTVTRIVKAAAVRAGKNAASFSAHSMRAGYATSEAALGASNRSIRKRTRHKSDAMVEGYVREAELLKKDDKK